MSATPFVLTPSYQLIAADVTAVVRLQLLSNPTRYQAGVNLAVAADTPEDDVADLQVVTGDTLSNEQLLEMAATGGLYARLAWGQSATALVL